MEKIIATVRKNGRQQIRVSLAQRGGRGYCILRTIDDPDEQLIVEVAALPNLIAVLGRTRSEARVAGLVEDEPEPELALLDAEPADTGDLTPLGAG